MGNVWFTWCCLQVLFILIVTCYGDVLDIKNVCKVEQDLDYTPTGYSCTFSRTHDSQVYVYQGKPIKTINFDTFNIKSTLIVFGIVDQVKIDRGSMELCNRIDAKNPSIVIVNGQNCENMLSSSQDSSSIVLTGTVSSMATWTSTSMDTSALATSPTPMITSALVTSASFIFTSTSSSISSPTSTPTCAPSHIEDRQDKDQILWILGLAASLLERTEIIIVMILSVLIGALKCYRRVERIFNALNEDPQGQPMQPPGQPMQPPGQPIQPQEQPMQPQGQPMQPQGQPMQPPGQPIQPQGQPMLPQGQPMQPQGQPIQPRVQPIQPRGQPRRSQRIRKHVNRLNI